MRAFTLAAMLLILCSGAVQARWHHHRHHHHSFVRVRNATSGPVVQTTVGGRQPGYPSAWCGAWMADHIGITGKLRRALWVARNWASWGHAVSGPAEHVIGVKSHHVFEVLRVTRPGRVLAISGNDGHAVKIRERSTAGVIAWRSAALEPVSEDILNAVNEERTEQ